MLRLRYASFSLALLALTATVIPVGALAQELRIHTFHVDQGHAALIIGPTGRTLLVDGGEDGMGTAVVVPALRALGVTRLDAMVASHYHSDHIGGLDEVVDAGFRPTVAYDRGTFGSMPSTTAFSRYVARVSSVRSAITTGTVIDLGGGATARCVVVNGNVLSRPAVDISGSAQFENSASVGLHIEYGSFDFWVAGDLTGGGNGTTDVESAVAPVVGDLDVYFVHHHGSNTSTNANWIATTAPEVSIVSCGSSNPYGHPTTTTVNRIVARSRATLLLGTTEGTGTIGPVVTGQNLEIATDGSKYRISWPGRRATEVMCDEGTVAALGASEVVVSELHPDPTSVVDADGEWFELGGIAGGARQTRGLAVHGQTEGLAFTIGTPFLLAGDHYLVIARNGFPGENGGVQADLVLPFGSFDLGNSSDVVELRSSGGAVLDRVAYGSSGWGWGAGRSAERIDRHAPAGASNFASAVNPYGSGDRGTPAAENSANVSNAYFAVEGTRAPGGTVSYRFYSPADVGRLYTMASSAGYFPGFFFGGAYVRLNPDVVFDLTLLIPGMSGVVPANGRARVDVPLPPDPLLSGFNFYSMAFAWTVESGGAPLVRSFSPLVTTAIQ
ncbi:MAG: MBL fold metallo-hydrolase [Planctomycetes bacterium]|nr:MBL fold metallo-hydrolase [Planctomycetota bacterium]